jgi:metallo-beta-lactamase family protein
VLKLAFYGADRDVTGSCHLVECAGKRILVDCGLFQGSRELSEENAEAFGFDPATIDYVLLTHAHLDHCGRLPLLSKRGFCGEIITTGATRELARLVMLDAAHLQEEEARSAGSPNARHPHNDPAAVPIYTIPDALNSLDGFGRTANYAQPLELAGAGRATFIDAGHILGSASIFLELAESGRAVRLLFSGDLGNAGRPLLRPPATPPRADVVVIETTYGDRLHKPIGPSIEEFYEAISDTFKRGGNVVIPTFALERAQELLYILHQGVATGRLSPSIQVFLDSPLAISATEVFRRHLECLDPQAVQLFREGHDPLRFPGLHLTRERSESVALNAVRSGAIIMAGSGMATGGRIRHHLKHNLRRAECSVIFVGFAASGTLAREIIDGRSPVRVLDEDVPVHARIYTINGFSAHADQAELLAWLNASGPARTFLTHGEEATMRQFAAKLDGTHVEMPVRLQAFEL